MRHCSYGRMPATLMFVLLAGARLLPAALPADEIKAVRVAEGPRIDGLLDDPVWQSVPAITGFRMVEPRPGEDPSEKTEARVLYDGHSLYVGVYCYDSEPGRISANTMAHDSGGGGGGYGMYGGYHGAATSSDDVVRVLLDPFQDKRNAYVFFVNPRGARGEGLAYAGDSSLNWDGIWEAKSRRLADGWSAEIRIPFKTISFRPGPDRLGPQHREDDRPQDGDDPPLRHDPGQQFLQSQRGGRARGHRGRQAGAGHHLPALRPGQRRQDDQRFVPVRRRLRRRLRPLQEHHAQPRRCRQLQHGLRRDRSRRAPHQPDPLPDVLPGKADVLPRRLGELQLQLERQLHPLLQPHHRALPGDARSPSCWGPRSTARSGTPT